MRIFKNEIIALLSGHLRMDEQQIAAEIEIPPDPQMGDFAFPCFKLAKELRRAPAQIAAEITASLQPGRLFDRIEPLGPYINFFCNRQILAEHTIKAVLTEKEAYGRMRSGVGQTVVIDFSSPNIAKPFGVTHLRSTVIGHSLYRIYHALGYSCVGINHLGDWGTQFGKIIAAYRRWGDETRLAEKPLHYLYELYVLFHREAEKNTALEEEARAWFKKLEEGDEEAKALWQTFRRLSLAEYNRIYQLLGVHFDSYQGESFYDEMLDDTIRLVEGKGLAHQSEGALIVDLSDEGMPPCLLRKQDGATLYATRDLCAVIYRYGKYRFAKMLYVVGSEQALHFQQIFAILKKLGYDWAASCVHVPFGLIRFKEGKMSTRQGTIIFLEDVISRAVSLAKKIIEEKNPSLAEKETVARQVGIGAVIFGDLSNDRIKNIEFDWDKVLDFSGETAPYIQYSHARICSILRKVKNWPVPFDTKLLTGDEEQTIISTLARFSEAVERAAQSCKPSIVARYLLDLAADFNRFYHQCPVLQTEDDIRYARLALIDSVRQVLKNGLYLLGISAPEEM